MYKIDNKNRNHYFDGSEVYLLSVTNALYDEHGTLEIEKHLMAVL